MSEQVERDGSESPRADAPHVEPTVVKVKGRGQHPNSKKNLRVGPPTVHGEPSRKDLIRMLAEVKQKVEPPVAKDEGKKVLEMPEIAREKPESQVKNLSHVPDPVSTKVTVDDTLDDKTLRTVIAALAKVQNVSKTLKRRKKKSHSSSSSSSDSEEKIDVRSDSDDSDSSHRRKKRKRSAAPAPSPAPPPAPTTYSRRPLPNHPGFSSSFWAGRF